MTPMVSKIPTLILGMDVSHGSPGRSDIPSIAAVCLLPSAVIASNKYLVVLSLEYSEDWLHCLNENVALNH
jgi:hypothetical protein